MSMPKTKKSSVASCAAAFNGVNARIEEKIEGTTVTITLHKDNYGHLKIEKESDFVANRAFDLNKKNCNGRGVQVIGHLRGGGIGRTLMRNQIEFIHAIGIDIFLIPAGFVGSYAWARVGFLPDKDSLESISRQVLERYTNLLPIVGDDLYSILPKETAELKNPKDFWTIADCDTDALFKKPEEKKLLETWSGAPWDPPPLLEGYTKESQGTLFNAWDSVQKTKSLTVGKILLYDVRWRGHIDMTDAEQMARVEKYVGGWKYITPPPAVKSIEAEAFRCPG